MFLAKDAGIIRLWAKFIFFWGGTMWQGIQRRFYFMMYYFGRTPQTSAEIDAAFEKIETEATIAADDTWCDCLVKAGPTVIQCKTRRTSTCQAMGQLRPDVNASPHTVGFCKSVSDGSK
ncbi:hypothetical protein BST65_03725 [Bradyrhizobium canariense]|uniref:hypothetical protein n=1 Tax=Bradyrhizobium canariense TaxID=255045 RepID=UPI000A1909C7|nr:hypothetical protein [Bradyrhizobium canariense]OSI32779.1 hypothetical protein BST65_03725 [Bradyrhizobium canariense]OSI49976.1 hypothetical protein BSZ20_06315 [Bradyrhizobium canariense]OSI55580.1 hypothetical protein BST67_04920 [Bradyrhizobium canariense]OSI58977.1 hypothetical protein BSZ15_07125 [Bradyrhizobium canariense]